MVRMLVMTRSKHVRTGTYLSIQSSKKLAMDQATWKPKTVEVISITSAEYEEVTVCYMERGNMKI